MLLFGTEGNKSAQSAIGTGKPVSIFGGGAAAADDDQDDTDKDDDDEEEEEEDDDEEEEGSDAAVEALLNAAALLDISPSNTPKVSPSKHSPKIPMSPPTPVLAPFRVDDVKFRDESEAIDDEEKAQTVGVAFGGAVFAPKKSVFAKDRPLFGAGDVSDVKIEKAIVLADIADDETSSDFLREHTTKILEGFFSKTACGTGILARNDTIDTITLLKTPSASATSSSGLAGAGGGEQFGSLDRTNSIASSNGAAAAYTGTGAIIPPLVSSASVTSLTSVASTAGTMVGGNIFGGTSNTRGSSVFGGGLVFGSSGTTHGGFGGNLFGGGGGVGGGTRTGGINIGGSSILAGTPRGQDGGGGNLLLTGTSTSSSPLGARSPGAQQQASLSSTRKKMNEQYEQYKSEMRLQLLGLCSGDGEKRGKSSSTPVARDHVRREQKLAPPSSSASSYRSKRNQAKLRADIDRFVSQSFPRTLSEGTRKAIGDKFEAVAEQGPVPSGVFSQQCRLLPFLSLFLGVQETALITHHISSFVLVNYFQDLDQDLQEREGNDDHKSKQTGATESSTAASSIAASTCTSATIAEEADAALVWKLLREWLSMQDEPEAYELLDGLERVFFYDAGQFLTLTWSSKIFSHLCCGMLPFSLLIDFLRTFLLDGVHFLFQFALAWVWHIREPLLQVLRKALGSSSSSSSASCTSAAKISTTRERVLQLLKNEDPQNCAKPHRELERHDLLSSSTCTELLEEAGSIRLDDIMHASIQKLRQAEVSRLETEMENKRKWREAQAADDLDNLSADFTGSSGEEDE
ncbi:unnamed protein product [Amoebophrya sp. A25]|nr:unnamed protein product [Amoebophrya sp. A25]|eukprot:GSA25T00001274001.1